MKANIFYDYNYRELIYGQPNRGEIQAARKELGKSR